MKRVALKAFGDFDNADELKAYMEFLKNNDDAYVAHMNKYSKDLLAFKNLSMGTGKFRAQNKIKRRDQANKYHDQMKGLAQIVGGGNDTYDISRTGWAVSEEAFKARQQESPATYMDWTAKREDLDKDGDEELIIRDHEGNPVYVNGYKLGDSRYAERREYYDTFPRQVQRRDTPKNTWIHQQKMDEQGEPQWIFEHNHRNPKAKPSLKSIFQQYVVSPILDILKSLPVSIISRVPSYIRGQVSLRFGVNAWNLLRIDVYERLKGKELKYDNEDQYKAHITMLNKLTKDDEDFRDSLKETIRAYIQGVGRLDDAIIDYFDDILIESVAQVQALYDGEHVNPKTKVKIEKKDFADLIKQGSSIYPPDTSVYGRAGRMYNSEFPEVVKGDVEFQFKRAAKDYLRNKLSDTEEALINNLEAQLASVKNAAKGYKAQLRAEKAKAKPSKYNKPPAVPFMKKNAPQVPGIIPKKD